MKSSGVRASSSGVSAEGFCVCASPWRSSATRRRVRAPPEEETTARVMTNARADIPAMTRISALGSRGNGFTPLLVLEPNGHELRYAGFLHRHSIQHVRAGNGALVVRDHDELGILGKLLQEIRQSSHIFFIQRRVDLVQEAEWGGLHHEDRE